MEEASTFDNDGKLKQYPTGTKTIDIASSGSVSIHSHLLNDIQGDNNSTSNIQTPKDISDADRNSFSGYKLNIVVGNSNCNQDYPAQAGCIREPQAVFYNSQAKEILTMDLKSIKNIVNYRR